MNVGKIAYNACRARKSEGLRQKPKDALYTRGGFSKSSQQSQLIGPADDVQTRDRAGTMEKGSLPSQERGAETSGRPRTETY